MPFEGVLVEEYEGTRRKHNMKFRQIGHKTSQYGQSFFLKTISAWNGLAFAEAPSLAVFRSNFIKNLCASLPHNTLEESWNNKTETVLPDFLNISVIIQYL